MDPHHVLRPCDVAGEAGDRQGRGVGSDDAVGTHGLLDTIEHLRLDLRILEDGLDDEVATGQRGIIGIGVDAREQGIAIGGFRPAPS